MSKEGQPDPLRLTGIHINFLDQVVTLEAQDGRRAKLSFGESTTLFESHPHPHQQQAFPVESDTPDELRAEPEDEPWEAPAAAESSSTDTAATPHEAREKQETVVLSGTLRTQPRQGRLDGQGHPTAWARLAVHEEGAEQAHLYSATFHRKTAVIALELARGAPLTVEGYPHAGDPSRKRMDTFSVIAVHQYPGKPERASRPRREEVKQS